MTIGLQHQCRYDRTKLSEPTDNLRRAPDLEAGKRLAVSMALANLPNERKTRQRASHG